MKKEDLYREIGLIDDKLIEEADVIKRKGLLSSKVLRIASLAACLVIVLVIGLVSAMKLRTPASKGDSDSITLPNLSGGVSVRLVEEVPMVSSSADLQILSQEDIFHKMNTIIFKGTIKSINNIELDFNGTKEYRALASIEVNEMYRGDLVKGETVTVLLPCGINDGIWVEDTETVSAMREGMTGIFMPMIYENTFIDEREGATLHLLELAPYGFSDGVRFAFLQTKKGIIFDHYTYKEITSAVTLDQVEGYIKKMIEK